MTGPDSSAALRRLLATPPGPLEAVAMSPAKALRLAMARAGEAQGGLIASVTGFGEDRQALAGLVQGLEDDALTLALEGPEGARGLAIWDMAAVSALIEHLITGRVAPAVPEGRAATRTDAAMVGDFLDAVLERFDAALAGAEACPPVSGFRAGAVIGDARAVSMALEDIEYRQYRVTVDFAEGVKSGGIRLVFPWCRAAKGCGGAAQWQQQWQSVVRASPVVLEAVLHRLTLPLETVRGLEVGALIPVPKSAIGAVSLEGLDRRNVGTGRLGQSNGFRAVRLVAHVAPAPAEPGAPVDGGGEAPLGGLPDGALAEAGDPSAPAAGEAVVGAAATGAEGAGAGATGAGATGTGATGAGATGAGATGAGATGTGATGTGATEALTEAGRAPDDGGAGQDGSGVAEVARALGDLPEDSAAGGAPADPAGAKAAAAGSADAGPEPMMAPVA